MSVESLLTKDSRLADMVLDKTATAKPVQTEPTPRQQQTDNVNKLSIAEQVEKAAAKQAENAVPFDNNQIRQTLEQINKLIPIANTRLVFEFDELGDPPIIKVIDKTSNELIREIPSQDLVKVAKAFSEMADNLTKAGALVNFQA
ncbi:flagellar protein FlaG [Arsukibacterium perlucidum]|uniref:flagellar protein FlaG n=1 Tax=Arsukibacterium perlucidum TaxID=368811 RepID=UPI0012F9CE28|nr:flagellar protein FlaG [Arsukibacterium perlucidum]